MFAKISISRRVAIAGMASLSMTTLSFADEVDSPIAHGVLAHNKLAQAFEATRHDFPDVNVVGPNGARPISQIAAGRTVLMPLWAEWCTPCLTELGDFARLQKAFGNSKFAIVPVLTGTRHKFTPETLASLLHILNAAIFEPLMEEDYGQKLLIGMAYQGEGPAIPCNLLIASNGGVVGREIGLKENDAAAEGGKERLNQALAGNSQSLWGTAVGDEFATCMANGFLNS